MGEDIQKATMEWKGLKVTVKLTIQNRQVRFDVGWLIACFDSNVSCTVTRALVLMRVEGTLLPHAYVRYIDDID